MYENTIHKSFLLEQACVTMPRLLLCVIINQCAMTRNAATASCHVLSTCCLCIDFTFVISAESSR